MISVSFLIMHNIKINYACIDDYRCDETTITLEIERHDDENDDNKIISREDFFKNVDDFIRDVSDKIELLNDISSELNISSHKFVELIGLILSATSKYYGSYLHDNLIN